MTRPDWLWEVNPLGKVPVLLYKVIIMIVLSIWYNTNRQLLIIETSSFITEVLCYKYMRCIDSTHFVP